MDSQPTRSVDNGTIKSRTTPMQVIFPALSRNGTDSIRKALEILGVGRTFHGFRLGERPEDMPYWLDLVNNKYPRSSDANCTRPITAADFDRVIGDCGAVTDMPCAAFWKELMDAYPDAKVILVERDVDQWYPSFKQVVVDGMMSRKGQIFANHWVATFVGDLKIEMMFRVFMKYFRARDRHQLSANAKQIYKEHNDAIRKACQEQGRSLLEYRLGDGWQPLCEFLNVEIPHKEKFPRGNEAKVMSDLTHRIQLSRIVSLGKMLAVRVSIAVVCAYAATVFIKKAPSLVEQIRFWEVEKSV